MPELSDLVDDWVTWEYVQEVATSVDYIGNYPAARSALHWAAAEVARTRADGTAVIDLRALRELLVHICPTTEERATAAERLGLPQHYGTRSDWANDLTEWLLSHGS